MPPITQLVDALTYYVVFLFSTTLHEAAHAWAAKRGGDLTAYHGGQVSLDPAPHIRREPFGMVVLPLLSALATGWPLGYASAPYDIRWAARYPKRAAMMALAGPAANLLLVILAALLIRGGEAAGFFYAPDTVKFGSLAASHAGGLWSSAAYMLSVFFSLNLLLAVFNLLPLPPLDGSGALPLVMSAESSRSYQEFLWSNPMIGWMGMFLAWQVFDVFFDPIFWGAVNLLYPGVSYG
ncbi:MAG: site-2 protease family protein [Gemmatimonadetes bacterium]|nr:site-2 protease family protein [Gemmatimonadota bacterium]